MKKNTMKKILLFQLLLLLIVSSCKQDKEKQAPIILQKDNIKYIDGPYVFKEAGNYRILRINQHDEIEEVIVDKIDSLLVQVPNQVPDHFYVKINSDNKVQPSTYEATDKIFATSDIEGNYYAFTKLLIGNNITDENLNWTFGSGHLVLNGDMVDRGEYVTQVLWLIYKLEQEAKLAGGQVHFINGNHEAMNLKGDFRYVDDKYQQLVYDLNMTEVDFFKKGNVIGNWLYSKNVIERIGNNLFTHGGIGTMFNKKQLDLDKINRIAQNNYGIDFSSKDTSTIAGLIFGSYGLLWYRGLVTDYKYYPKSTTNQVDQFLEYYNSKRIIIGHCVVDDISTDYEGKVVRIDLHHPVNGNTHEESFALLIENDKLYKVNIEGEKIEI